MIRSVLERSEGVKNICLTAEQGSKLGTAYPASEGCQRGRQDLYCIVRSCKDHEKRWMVQTKGNNQVSSVDWQLSIKAAGLIEEAGMQKGLKKNKEKS